MDLLTDKDIESLPPADCAIIGKYSEQIDGYWGHLDHISRALWIRQFVSDKGKKILDKIALKLHRMERKHFADRHFYYGFEKDMDEYEATIATLEKMNESIYRDLAKEDAEELKGKAGTYSSHPDVKLALSLMEVK